MSSGVHLGFQMSLGSELEHLERARVAFGAVDFSCIAAMQPVPKAEVRRTTCNMLQPSFKSKRVQPKAELKSHTILGAIVFFDSQCRGKYV